MSSVSLSAGPIHLGLDTSKNTIVEGSCGRRRSPRTWRGSSMMSHRCAGWLAASRTAGVLRGGADRVRALPAAALDGGGV